ncbi:MAG: isoprenylcysteine carboxylmethyltransferase family protein [Gammaproteobacteria bacterium]|nr:isoprenylcysteine carboxylmethyltransferase family protein [Gammaproteobacteria bacterium]
MKRTAILFYGTANYLLGVAALVYLIAFLFNLYVPKTIDSGMSVNGGLAALADVGLIALFGLQHSIMPRRGFKSRLLRIVPAAAERSTYMLVTALATFSLCLFWQPLPARIWQVANPLVSQVLLGIGLAGWGLVLVSTFLINHFDLFGLRQVWLQFVKREYTPLPFKTVALYRYVRHPIMTGVFVGIWVTPSMTVGHLLFALGMSIYILIGVYHEEKDLIREFGDKYRRYSQATGRFVPVWNSPSRLTGIETKKP